MLRLELSRPPLSVNKAYGVRQDKITGRRGMMKNRGSVNWQAWAIGSLSQQPGNLPENCFWRADILIPGRTKGDLDNFIKPLIDALHRSGKAPDDRYLVDLRIRFYSGAVVVIALQREELKKWAQVKRISRSLWRKLAKSYC